MVDIMMQNPAEESIKENIPLSMIFSEGSYVDESLYKTREAKIDAFIAMCKNTRAENLSEEAVVDRVVRNALHVEFGPEIQGKDDMVNMIVSGLCSDLILKEEILHFAQRHFQMLKIDNSLIN